MMLSQLKTDMRFHTSLKPYSSLNFPSTSSKIETLFRSAKSEQSSFSLSKLLVLKSGRYELLFDGFYPLLEVDLRDEFVEKLFSKRQKLMTTGNLWEVDSQRVAKLAANSALLYGKTTVGSRSEISSVVHFHCEGYALENTRISLANIIITESHLM